MRKNILVAFALSSLLIIAPLSVIAQENKISSNLTEQPDIDGLVAQIRTVINEVLENYRHIPIISSLCNVILNLAWYPGNILYCIFLMGIIILLTIIFLLVFLIFLVIPPNLLDLLGIFENEHFRNCPPFTPFFDWPSKSIYTIIETKDNINSFDGCPCLQE